MHALYPFESPVESILLLAEIVQTQILKIVQQTAKPPLDSSRVFHGGRFRRLRNCVCTSPVNNSNIIQPVNSASAIAQTHGAQTNVQLPWKPDPKSGNGLYVCCDSAMRRCDDQAQGVHSVFPDLKSCVDRCAELPPRVRLICVRFQ